MTINQQANRVLMVCAAVVASAALLGLGYVSGNVYVGMGGVAVALGVLAYVLTCALAETVDLGDTEPVVRCPSCGTRMFYESAVWHGGREVCYRCAREQLAMWHRRTNSDDEAA